MSFKPVFIIRPEHEKYDKAVKARAQHGTRAPGYPAPKRWHARAIARQLARRGGKL